MSEDIEEDTSDAPILRIEDPAVATTKPNLFIPDETVDLDSDISLPDAASLAPAAKQASLITRLSGLWAPKPEDTQTSEDAKSTTSNVKSASLMDLPRSPASSDSNISAQPNQASLNISPASAADTDENELEIPAFLRRQAN